MTTQGKGYAAFRRGVKAIRLKQFAGGVYFLFALSISFRFANGL